MYSSLLHALMNLRLPPDPAWEHRWTAEHATSGRGRHARRAEAPGRTDADLEALQRWLGTLSGRWALPILDVLAEGPTCHDAVLARLEAGSPDVLTKSLRRLEADGLIRSEPFGRRGRRYLLTARGASLRRRTLPRRTWAAQQARPERGRPGAPETYTTREVGT